MSDAGIKNVAELERLWVAEYGDDAAHVRRQMARLLNKVKHPRPETAVKLAGLTGKSVDYFTEDLKRAEQELEDDVRDHTQAIDDLREAMRLLLGAMKGAGLGVPALPPGALPPTERGNQA